MSDKRAKTKEPEKELSDMISEGRSQTTVG